MKNVFIVLSMVLALGIVPIAYAEETPNATEHSEGMSRWHKRMEGKMQDIYAKLNLTEEQRKQLDENKSKNKEGKRALFEKMRSLRESFNQELMQSEINMEKVHQLNDQLKNLQAQMVDERLNSVLEVRRILTPEQFKQFLLLMEEKHKGKDWGRNKE